MQGFLTENMLVTKVLGYTAAGTTTVPSTALDMENWDGVCYLVSLGTSAANNGAKVTESANSNMSSSADLAGSHTYLDGTATQLVTDVMRPPARYNELNVLRGTSTTIEAVWAIQYRGRSLPPSGNVTTAQFLSQLLNPVEGTA